MLITAAGADISNEWFDICVFHNGKEMHRRFANSLQGFRDCMRWLKCENISKLQLVIEPTGRYGEAFAEHFHEQGHQVLLAQPLKFRRYAESIDMRSKSDYKDCYGLARLSHERAETLPAWKPKSELEWELRDMHLLIRSLTKRSVVLQCQLECKLRSKYVEAQLRLELERCQSQLDEVLERAQGMIKQDQRLASDFRLVMSIPGVGPKSATMLLTLIDFRQFKCSRSLACFLGLTKKMKESGTSVKAREHISKRGNSFIRGALFMPARTARKHNPQIAVFAEEMKSKGKHDWTIQMAVIRKLVTMSWAVIVNQTEYDSQYLNSHCKPM